MILVATRTEVRGEDQDGVAEVHRPALAVGQATFVQHLQQHVEHVRVGLLDLVEQDHRVRTTPHRLGQLTAGLVPDVAGRSTDEPCHAVLLAVLAHVDADHRPLVVEQELGERLGELGLADTGGAEEHERAERPVRVRDARAGTTHRVGHRLHRILLTDDPVSQFLFHAQQLGGLAFEHASGRDSGPRRHDLGHVVGSDLLLQHHVLRRIRAGLLDRGLELLLQSGDTAVPQLGGASEITVALGAISLAAKPFQLLLEVSDRVDRGLLRLPPGGELVELLLLVGQLGAELLEPLLRRRVGLLLQGDLLDLETADDPLDLVDLDGARVDLHPQPRRGLVDEVDGLVGQEPRGDVAIGKRCGSDQCGVGDAHAVVHLVPVLQAAEDADGVFDRRLADVHLLEATL